MPQRLNWTERRRIRRTDALIAVDRSSQPASFTATLLLSDYDLPMDARVVLEAYRQTTWRRFDYGTVALPRPTVPCTLEAFGSADAILFRLKILASNSDDGRILAEADRLRVTDPDNEDASRRSLLPTRGDDLGEEVYQLSFDGPNESPMLTLNNRLGDWRQTARTAQFRALVYPQLLRLIIARAISGYDEDDGGWQADWISFARGVPGAGAVPDVREPDSEECRAWIADVVSAFCRNQQFLTRYSSLLTEGGPSA